MSNQRVQLALMQLLQAFAESEGEGLGEREQFLRENAKRNAAFMQSNITPEITPRRVLDGAPRPAPPPQMFTSLAPSARAFMRM